MAEPELEYVLRQQGGVRGVQELRVVRRMNQKYLLCQKDLRIFVNLHQHNTLLSMNLWTSIPIPILSDRQLVYVPVKHWSLHSTTPKYNCWHVLHITHDLPLQAGGGGPLLSNWIVRISRQHFVHYCPHLATGKSPPSRMKKSIVWLPLFIQWSSKNSLLNQDIQVMVELVTFIVCEADLTTGIISWRS